MQGFGLALGFVVSGAVVMEIVFSYPGIGCYLVHAVGSKDFPLMQAHLPGDHVRGALANLIIDMIIVLFDPAGPDEGGDV